MSNKSDVGFSIGGELKDEEFIFQLARDITERALPDFGVGPFSKEQDVIDHVLTAISGGEIVWFGAEDTGDTFEDVASLCEKYGMSYRITTTGGYESLPEVRTWKPSMAGENHFYTDFDDNPVVGIFELLDMINREGLSAAQLVSKFKAVLPNNDDYKITASEDILQKLRNSRDAASSVNP